jgi:hypothetical protein
VFSSIRAFVIRFLLNLMPFGSAYFFVANPTRHVIFWRDQGVGGPESEWTKSAGVSIGIGEAARIAGHNSIDASLNGFAER